jgi:uncharacterized YccA/Bax inhibitor family protein
LMPKAFHQQSGFPLRQYPLACLGMNIRLDLIGLANGLDFGNATIAFRELLPHSAYSNLTLPKGIRLMATSNPAMNEAVYLRSGRAETSVNAMTLQGTVGKTAILLLILLVAAGYTWSQAINGSMNVAYGLLLAESIGGFVVALLTIFKPNLSPITAPIYAALEGLLLGAISAVFEANYPGIVIQAVGLCIGVLAVMLFLFGTGVIRATEKFKIGLIAATGAICLVYLVDMIASFFGTHLPFIHESGALGIGFSLVVVVIAALNLILDFDFIERGVQQQAPKYMEWYGGFSLLVTLIWMYLEILRLLAKMRGSRN